MLLSGRVDSDSFLKFIEGIRAIFTVGNKVEKFTGLGTKDDTTADSETTTAQ